MITINGTTYSGRNVTIRNGDVIIDGVKIDGDKHSGTLELKITGNLTSLKADCDVHVTGDVGGDVDAGGSVSCGNVNGNVDAGGSVNCESVGGDVDAGGSVFHR
jgi:cytoskeletal protein CcmA (bactofilin family)